jgi:hypothetical protein
MEQDARISSLVGRLSGQPRVVAVEAAYWLSIAMTHSLSQKRLLERVEAEVTVPYREQALQLAVEMAREIERIEGKEIAKLPADVRLGYATRFANLILVTGDTEQASATDVDATLQELQAAI